MRVLLWFIICSGFLYSQEYGMGALLDPELYKDCPTAAPLTRGDYTVLPPQASLKQYCPTPGNQGSTSTCAGWSSTYAGRTILEAIKRDWKKDEINKYAFSPSYVYNQLKKGNDCSGGISIGSALEVLKNQGALSLNEFDFNCSRKVTDIDRKIASGSKILEYRVIVDRSIAKKTPYIKKSLAEGNPVIIAFDCPPSFSMARQVWKPAANEYKEFGRGHGMAIIGYDDNKSGGAFEVMNSWGTDWGNAGFMWITYSDMDYFCKYGFELLDRKAQAGKKYDLSGGLLFRESNGNEMTATHNGRYYVMDKSYASGTLFQVYVTNDEPAYVYAFGTDNSFKVERLFPFNDKMIAYLPYKKNDVAIPDEDSYTMLDSASGASYYCFLYSTKPLEIDEIIRSIENGKGTMEQRFNEAMKIDGIDARNIEFGGTSKILFKAKSGGKTVIPVLVEIPHY
jgi:hypothetical protein